MFEITERNLLYTLLKALLTLKFECDAETAAEYCGSPHIAEICNRLYDELIASNRSEFNEWSARQLESTRPLTGRTIEVTAFQEHLRATGVSRWWRNASIEEKNKYLRVFMSPYTVDGASLQSLVVEADKLAESLP
jgi:hypothetical protein